MPQDATQLGVYRKVQTLTWIGREVASRKISLVRCGSNDCLKDKYHELNINNFNLLDVSQTKYQVMTEMALILFWERPNPVSVLCKS